MQILRPAPLLRFSLALSLSLALALPAAVTAEEAAAKPEGAPETRAFTGRIDAAGPKQIVVQTIGNAQKIKSRLVRVRGNAETPVSGQGKNHWSKLSQGDLVVVAYTPGDPPITRKVLVLPATALPAAAQALGQTPRKGKRVFTGWVKHKDAERLVVRTPDSPRKKGPEGETKEFVRIEETVVEMLRDDWEEVRKGDRVSVHFKKGSPRPIERLVVVTRGDEKPLPPGLRARLFDPEYDASPEDVDGYVAPKAATATP